MPTVDDRLAYEMWALERVAEALERTPAPRYKAILLYAHIVNAHSIWLARIRGHVPQVEPWTERSLSECREQLISLKSGYRDVLVHGADGVRESIAYRNTRGEAFRRSIEDIMEHVLLHSAYHRGQINALIRAAGAVPAVVDYIVYRRASGGPATDPREEAS